jgi:nucleoside-diphosphate-sugar epimerase
LLPSGDAERRQPGILLAKKLLGWEPQVDIKDGLPENSGLL